MSSIAITFGGIFGEFSSGIYPGSGICGLLIGMPPSTDVFESEIDLFGILP